MKTNQLKNIFICIIKNVYMSLQKYINMKNIYISLYKYEKGNR